MTFPKKTNTQLTKQEFDEMVALKNAIHELPQAVSPEKMEKFTELMVRSLEGKGDPVSVQTKPTNY